MKQTTMSSSRPSARRTRRVRNVESGGGILAVLAESNNQVPQPASTCKSDIDPPTSIPVKRNKLKKKDAPTKEKDTKPYALSHAQTSSTSKNKDAVPETVVFSPVRSEEDNDTISAVTMDVGTRHKTKNTKEGIISPLSTSFKQESDEESANGESEEESSADDKQEESEDDCFSEEEGDETQEDQDCSSSEENSPLKLVGTRKRQNTKRNKLFEDDSDEEFEYDNDDEYDPDAEVSDEEPDEDDDESEEFELDDDDIRITQKQSPARVVAKGLDNMKKSDDSQSRKDDETSLSEKEAMYDVGSFVDDDEVTEDNNMSPLKETTDSNIEKLGSIPKQSTESSYSVDGTSEEEHVTTVVEILSDSMDDESVMEVECDEDSLGSEEEMSSVSSEQDDGPIGAFGEEEDVHNGRASGQTCPSHHNCDIPTSPDQDSDDESFPHDNDNAKVQTTKDSLPDGNLKKISSSDQDVEKFEKNDSDIDDSSSLNIRDLAEVQKSSFVEAASSDNHSFAPINENDSMDNNAHSEDTSLQTPIDSTENTVGVHGRVTHIKQIVSTTTCSPSSTSKESKAGKPCKVEVKSETQLSGTSLNIEETNLDYSDEKTCTENKSLKAGSVYMSSNDVFADKENQVAAVDRGGILMESEVPHRTFQRNRSEGIIRQGQWTIGSRIGTGSFGVVHVGMNHRNGSLMAVKSIHMLPEIMTDIRREIDLLKSLKHVNVVRYYGAEINGNDLHIFQEWVAGGSVSDLLSKFGAFPFPVIQSYAEQTLCGLAFLHTNNILHRDIKGSNLLVTDSGIVKLADFGGSKRMREFHSDMMMSMTMRGTPYFMAPEVFEQKYSAKADVWAVGCVFYQMATASVPWKNLGFNNPFALCRHLQDSEGPPALPRTILATDAHVLNHFLALLTSCFHRNPFDRPSIMDLLQDPFFMEKEYLSDDEYVDSPGLFSPDVLRSRAARRSSPMMTSVKARVPESSPSGRVVARIQTPPRPRRNSIGPPTSPFMSPPLPKRCDRDAEIPSQPYSPAKETSEWPSWAKQKYDETNHKVKEASLLDSLAYSTDSAVRTTEDPMQGSSGQSLLNGLAFLSIGCVDKERRSDN